MEQEKRVDKRQVLDVDIIVHGIHGKSRNLSIGGMCAILTKEIPILIDINVTLQLPDQNLNIVATALRCTPITANFYEAGMYFQTAKMSLESRQALADFLGIKLLKP